MANITINNDLETSIELDKEALRAVSGGWAYQQNGIFTSMSIGNYGISNFGLSDPLAAQLSAFGNHLNHSIMATQGNEAAMYQTVLGGVREYRIATGGQIWGGFYPGGRGLFF